MLGLKFRYLSSQYILSFIRLVCVRLLLMVMFEWLTPSNGDNTYMYLSYYYIWLISLYGDYTYMYLKIQRIV